MMRSGSTPAALQPLFHSFFLGGFECSTHRLRNGRRLDLIAATEHDQWIEQDYLRLLSVGISAARDAVRWHLVEPQPRRYNFASVRPMIRAARRLGIQIIWDLFHYGWPDDIDIFSPAFVDRFARMAGAFARVVQSETDGPHFFTPVNEISFVSWAGGEAQYLNPFCQGRGLELKGHLTRAAIAACEAIWDVIPGARIVHAEPIIHITADHSRPHEHEIAEEYRLSMFQAMDMLCGLSWPDLGGHPKYLDIIGVNYYWNNQWVHEGRTLQRDDPQYRPVVDILGEIYRRYGRPLVISETGIEDCRRAEWLAYMTDESLAALDRGIPLHGLCLYPIVNHPGWDNDRHCHNGLWDYPDAEGRREIHLPLAAELMNQQRRLQQLHPWTVPAEPEETEVASVVAQ